MPALSVVIAVRCQLFVLIGSSKMLALSVGSSKVPAPCDSSKVLASCR
jgi:hypothetical protein